MRSGWASSHQQEEEGEQEEQQQEVLEGQTRLSAAVAAEVAAALQENMNQCMPPEQLEMVNRAEEMMRELHSAGSLGEGPEVEQSMRNVEMCARLVREMHAGARGMVLEAEDCLQPAQEQAMQPGAEYFAARLRRATAVPPAERNPEVAAFVESAQLCLEICELLPLAPSGRPPMSSFEPRRQEVVALALAKYCRCLFISPTTQPAGHINPVPSVHSYHEYGMSRADWNVVNPISFTSSSAGSSASTAAGSDRGGGEGGGISGSDCGPHGVPQCSALRLVLHLATLAAASGIPVLLRARMASAALDVLTHPGCQAAIEKQLGELAAGQPAHHHPLLLTVHQLRYVCCATLAYLRYQPDNALPTPTPSTRDSPTFRMTAAEIEGEIKGAVERGQQGMLQLQPENPRSHLAAVQSYVLAVLKGGAHTAAGIHHSMEAHRLARLQRSPYWEVRASMHAVMQLFSFINAAHPDDNNSDSGSSSSTAHRRTVAQALMRQKPSGTGAGAARRQQRREQQEREQAVDAHPGIPAALLAEALAAYRQAGQALKACKRVLPEQWNTEIEAPWEAVQKLVPALEAHLEHAQLSGSSIGAGFATQRMRSLGHAMLTGVGSGGGEQLATTMAGVAAELQSLAGSLQLGTHLKQLKQSSPGGLLVCSGCGSQAVGLRKCAVCRKAQYCSRECQKAHWRKHKQECQALTSGDDDTGS